MHRLSQSMRKGSNSIRLVALLLVTITGTYGQGTADMPEPDVEKTEIHDKRQSVPNVQVNQPSYSSEQKPHQQNQHISQQQVQGQHNAMSENQRSSKEVSSDEKSVHSPDAVPLQSPPTDTGSVNKVENVDKVNAKHVYRSTTDEEMHARQAHYGALSTEKGGSQRESYPQEAFTQALHDTLDTEQTVVEALSPEHTISSTQKNDEIGKKKYDESLETFTAEIVGTVASSDKVRDMDSTDATPQVTPPILKENEKDHSEVPEEDEEKIKLTPEQIKAEELFQTGEKLINATYYKNYKEAYLHFFHAAEMNHSRAKEYVAFGVLFGDYLPQNITKAQELFQELANKGSPKAQLGLTFMYSAGFHFNSSQAKALIYSTFGALGGDPMAQMTLGYRYYSGIGVESTCETALTFYRKVATKVAESVTLAGGPVVQRVRLQEEAESQGTNNSPLLDEDLLQYYHFLADKGDQQAQVVLGTLYYQGGKGVQINHEQAYHYFSTAAESGSAHALGYLGKMHCEGSPVVKQNNQTAFEFFMKAADKNNHIGQAGLGMVFLNGLGVDKDLSKSFRYFSLASDQGSVDGQLQLGIMYFSGIGVKKDYKMAVKYFTMASQNGHVLAFFNLAQMHATGTGVLRNCHTAVELFKNVAERGRWSEMLMDAHRMYHEGNVDTALVKYMFLAELGYEVAQSNVAYVMDNGVTDKFSNYETYQRALLQYSRAASQGSTHARLKMGDYHYYGLGTDVDYESAASHYRLASEQQHNAQAMFNLGYMHERGLGLRQDVHLAKRFYDMAAETSIDAHVPVTLALLKLGLLYGMDIFNKEFQGIHGVISLIDPVYYFGPEWDLYLASLLAVSFGVIFFLRRR